jgi:hypothetical protein
MALTLHEQDLLEVQESDLAMHTRTAIQVLETFGFKMEVSLQLDRMLQESDLAMGPRTAIQVLEIF